MELWTLCSSVVGALAADLISLWALLVRDVNSSRVRGALLLLLLQAGSHVDDPLVKDWTIGRDKERNTLPSVMILWFLQVQIGAQLKS